MTKTLVRLLACLPLFLADTWAQGLDVMFVLDFTRHRAADRPDPSS
jgi:hypothetical protein